jgi:hypothetical protein
LRAEIRRSVLSSRRQTSPVTVQFSTTDQVKGHANDIVADGLMNN